MVGGVLGHVAMFWNLLRACMHLCEIEPLHFPVTYKDVLNPPRTRKFAGAAIYTFFRNIF